MAKNSVVLLAIVALLLLPQAGASAQTLTPRAYLPFISQPIPSTSTLYDNFDNAFYNASFNPSLWLASGDPGYTRAQTPGVGVGGTGAMVFTNTTAVTAGSGARLRMIKPLLRTWAQLSLYQADLKLGTDIAGGFASATIAFSNDSSTPVNGHSWLAQCYLTGPGGTTAPDIQCDIETSNRTLPEYTTPTPFPATYNTFYNVKIVTNPTTGAIQFYANNTLIGSHTPSDAAVLVSATKFQPEISVFTKSAGGTGTRYFDNVNVTPAP